MASSRVRASTWTPVATPLGLGRRLGRFGVLSHHEDDLVVLADATGGQFASQEGRVEVHVGQRREYERGHEL